MLTYQNVSKLYPGGVQALVGFSLEVKAGEFVVFIGPSGSGKTTALKVANRLIEPTSGMISLEGQDITQADPYELRHKIGYALQGVGLFPHMTVAENIAIVPEVLGWSQQRRRERVDELLDLAGLEPAKFRGRYPHELSGGQQQRVGVLRALAADPPLILMDEPFGALDPLTRADLQDEMLRLQETVKKTIVFVTHDMSEALRLADRIVVMREGRAAQVGTPRAIVERPSDRFVANFVRRSRVALPPEHLTLEAFVELAPPAVSPGATVAEALVLLEKHNARELLVRDQRRVLGLVARSAFSGVHSGRSSVAECLGRPVQSVRPGDTVHGVVTLMNRLGVAVLPVVEGERLMGIVRMGRLAEAAVSHVWGDGAVVDESAD